MLQPDIVFLTSRKIPETVQRRICLDEAGQTNFFRRICNRPSFITLSITQINASY